MDEENTTMTEAWAPRYAVPPSDQGRRHIGLGGNEGEPTLCFSAPATQQYKYDGTTLISSTSRQPQILGLGDDMIGRSTPLLFGYGYQSGANGMPDHLLRRPMNSPYADLQNNNSNKRSSMFEPLMNMMSCSNKMMMMSSQEMVEAKAVAASRSHSEAERRRRERINRHLTTLRGLLPNTTKTDKASLLREVIEHVKELKRMVEDIEKASPVPSESDEISVEEVEQGQLMIRASLSCDDRPDLFTDLIKTLRTLRLRAVKAEMATLGGRVKNVFFVTKGDDEVVDNDDDNIPSVSSIQDALKSLLDKNSLGADLATANNTKRQRQVGQFS